MQYGKRSDIIVKIYIFRFKNTLILFPRSLPMIVAIFYFFCTTLFERERKKNDETEGKSCVLFFFLRDIFTYGKKNGVFISFHFDIQVFDPGCGGGHLLEVVL